MPAMLDAFKIKPYDLEPVFSTWTDGPRFEGNPKKDMPIDEWLDKIKAGCEERKIPEEYWYKVAQHFMGPKAKERFNELKAVIAKVHDGKYRWSWKKFKVAMESMGWAIDATQKETIKVSNSTGSWWRKKKASKDETPADDARRSTLSRSTSFWVKRSSEGETPSDSSASQGGTGKKASEDMEPAPLRRMPTRAGSDFWPVKRKTQDDAEERPPLPPKPASEMAVTTRRSASPTPITSSAVEAGSATTTVTEAPIWLLNACNALEYITSEHPKAMSIISAILITVGSIPAIPAITAGAGGAVLASGAAHAVGAIAVGLGQALSMTVKNQGGNQSGNQSGNEVQAPSTVR